MILKVKKERRINMDFVLSYFAKILQHFALSSVNSTCIGPAYQPAEPDVLKK